MTRDTIVESSETFAIQVLDDNTNQVVTAVETILDGDAPVSTTLSINSPAAVAEGNSGTTLINFTVTRSDTSGSPTATYTINTGTADANDFAFTTANPQTGTVTFAAGATTATISVPVRGDTAIEGNEGFSVTLSNPQNATISTATGNGTILNDDANYSISNANAAEGNSGNTPLTFTVTRSGATDFGTTLYAVPSSGSATAGSDFVATPVAVNFTPSQTSATFSIPLIGDSAVEPNESFTVNLFNDYNFSTNTFGTQRASATGTIVNDDTAANQVQGTNGNDLLYATGNGPSTLVGFDGNDTYVVRNINDVIREYQGGGNDIVYSSISYTLNADAQVENLVTQTNADTTALNLIGNGYNQYVVGNFGNNVLNGNGGIDTLVGLKGDDTYSVGDARSVVLENGGEGNDIVFATVSYKLAAGQEIETLSTQTQSDTTALNMIGNEFGQKVIGNNGANLLDGGAGADTLIGLGGADTFSFSTALGNGNVDTIQDYQAGTDHIQLLSSVFTGLSAGTLASGAFVNGTTATAASAQILYNQATGQLYFDADGTGSGAAVLFATVNPGAALSASDFQVASAVPTP